MSHVKLLVPYFLYKITNVIVLIYESTTYTYCHIIKYNINTRESWVSSILIDT